MLYVSHRRRSESVDRWSRLPPLRGEPFVFVLIAKPARDAASPCVYSAGRCVFGALRVRPIVCVSRYRPVAARRANMSRQTQTHHLNQDILQGKTPYLPLDVVGHRRRARHLDPNLGEGAIGLGEAAIKYGLGYNMSKTVSPNLEDKQCHQSCQNYHELLHFSACTPADVLSDPKCTWVGQPNSGQDKHPEISPEQEVGPHTFITAGMPGAIEENALRQSPLFVGHPNAVQWDVSLLRPGGRAAVGGAAGLVPLPALSWIAGKAGEAAIDSKMKWQESYIDCNCTARDMGAKHVALSGVNHVAAQKGGQPELSRSLSVPTLQRITERVPELAELARISPSTLQKDIQDVQNAVEHNQQVDLVVPNGPVKDLVLEELVAADDDKAVADIITISANDLTELELISGHQ
eukprot:gene9972-1798_t